ncbi:hypothetical protein HQ544_03200 [Candidatus Falkowbacteria bacterium]|nr:hypothetical protein [Candidatus Falkowbacteria bacterium]
MGLEPFLGDSVFFVFVLVVFFVVLSWIIWGVFFCSWGKIYFIYFFGFGNCNLGIFYFLILYFIDFCYPIPSVLGNKNFCCMRSSEFMVWMYRYGIDFSVRGLFWMFVDTLSIGLW